MTEASIIGLFVATVSFGALLYLAALGELLAEKAGVLNLGVEGMMAIGAVTAFIVGVELKNPWAALLVAMLSGALLASVHGVFTCLLYTSPSPRDQRGSRMPSSA